MASAASNARPDGCARKDAKRKVRWIASEDVINTSARSNAIAKARNVAHRKFGVDLKKWQAEAIADAFCKKDVMVSAGTGSGKSMIFQCLPYMAAGGIILVVSPLLSLMHDQVCIPSGI